MFPDTDSLPREFILGFQNRKDLRRKKAAEVAKAMEKKTKREARKMVCTHHSILRTATDNRQRQQHMMMALNQMRGIGDMEDDLRLPEADSTPKTPKAKEEKFEDTSYKITTTVTDLDNDEEGMGYELPNSVLTLTSVIWKRNKVIVRMKSMRVIERKRIKKQS